MANITGSLQQKSGMYYAVLNLKENGKRKQKWIATGFPVKVGFKRKAEAELNKQIFFHSNDFAEKLLLFSDVVSEWLQSKKGCVELTTFEAYENQVNNHIIPYFRKKNISLSELTHHDLKSYYSFLTDEKNFSLNTVKKHHIAINQCLKYAMKEEYIFINPADKIQPFAKTHYTAKYYNIEQLKKLLSCIVGHELEPAILLAVYYGLRRSEIGGLKWENVDFFSKTITIKNTIVPVKSVVEKERTKNKSSYRTLPLIPQVEKYLSSISDRCESGYIISLDVREISKKFKCFLLQNKLPPIRLHDLRHSCASLLLSQGFSLKMIQEWLGHSTITTTADLYSHIDFKDKVTTGQLLNDVLTKM